MSSDGNVHRPVSETTHFETGSTFPEKNADLMRLYSMKFCPYAQRTRLVLAAKRIPNEVVNINLFAKPEWYFKLNPLGKVPCLEFNGQLVFESLITADYLDEVYPEPPLNSKDPLQKARDRMFVELFNQLNVEGVWCFVQTLQGQRRRRSEKQSTDKTSESGPKPGMLDYMIWPWIERLAIIPILNDAFGAPAASTGAFTFGQTAAPSSFAFGSSGSSFGQTAQQPAAAPSFSFGGQAAAPTSSAPPAYSFTSPPANSSVFGQPAASTTAAAPSFGGFGATQGATTFGQPATATSLFGGATSTPAFGQTPATSAPTLSFGQPAAAATSSAAPSFGFGQSATSTLPSFGAAAAPTLTFGQSTTAAPAPAAPTLTFGQQAATSAAAAPAPSFGFGGSSTFGQAASTGGLSFAPSTTAPAPTLTFGQPTLAPAPAAAPAPSLGFGQPLSFGAPATAAPAATAAPTLSFGAPATSTATAAANPSLSFQLGQPAATTAPLSFGAPAAASTATAAPTQPSLSFTAPVASTATVAPTPSVSAAPAVTSAAPSFSFGTAVTSAPAAGFSLTSTAATTSAPAATAVTSTSTTTTTDSTPAAPASAALTFRQLEEMINKWSVDLDEQEKVFLNQASSVASWDRLLVTNGEKIVTLSESVDRVKQDQIRLESELDFVRGQQRELEEMLLPLEDSLQTETGQSAVLQSGVPHDAEREHTYQLAENIDSQMRRLSDDLKEIIERMNSAGRQNETNFDPISKIARILNAHTDALQWAESNCTGLQRKLDDVGRALEQQRRDQDRSFRFA
nr:EOG090X0EZJ [Sida crystallina]